MWHGHESCTPARSSQHSSGPGDITVLVVTVGPWSTVQCEACAVCRMLARLLSSVEVQSFKPKLGLEMLLDAAKVSLCTFMEILK